jgi:hypothetical protein
VSWKQKLFYISKNLETFLQDLDICTSELNEIIDVPMESTCDRVNNSSERKSKRKKHNTKQTSTVLTHCSFDLWLSMNGMKRLPHKSFLCFEYIYIYI